MSSESMSAANTDSKAQQLNLLESPQNVLQESVQQESDARDLNDSVYKTVLKIQGRLIDSTQGRMSENDAAASALSLTERALRGYVSDDTAQRDEYGQLLQQNAELQDLLYTRDVQGDVVGYSPRHNPTLVREVLEQTDKVREAKQAELAQKPGLVVALNRQMQNALTDGLNRVVATKTKATLEFGGLSQDITAERNRPTTEEQTLANTADAIRSLVGKRNVKEDKILATAQAIHNGIEEAKLDPSQRLTPEQESQAQALEQRNAELRAQKQAVADEQAQKQAEAQAALEVQNKALVDLRIATAIKAMPESVAQKLTDEARAALSTYMSPDFDANTPEGAQAIAAIEAFKQDPALRLIKPVLNNAIQSGRRAELPQVEAAKPTTPEDIIHDTIDSLGEAGVNLDSKKSVILAAVMQGTRPVADLTAGLGLDDAQRAHIEGIIANHAARLPKVASAPAAAALPSQDAQPATKPEQKIEVKAEQKDPLIERFEEIGTKYGIKLTPVRLNLLKRLTHPDENLKLSTQQLNHSLQEAFGGREKIDRDPSAYAEFTKELDTILDQRDREFAQAQVERKGPVDEDLAHFANRHGIDISTDPRERLKLEGWVSSPGRLTERDYQRTFGPDYKSIMSDLEAMRAARGISTKESVSRFEATRLPIDQAQLDIALKAFGLSEASVDTDEKKRAAINLLNATDSPSFVRNANALLGFTTSEETTTPEARKARTSLLENLKQYKNAGNSIGTQEESTAGSELQVMNDAQKAIVKSFSFVMGTTTGNAIPEDVLTNLVTAPTLSDDQIREALAPLNSADEIEAILDEVKTARAEFSAKATLGSAGAEGSESEDDAVEVIDQAELELAMRVFGLDASVLNTGEKIKAAVALLNAKDTPTIVRNANTLLGFKTHPESTTPEAIKARTDLINKLKDHNAANQPGASEQAAASEPTVETQAQKRVLDRAAERIITGLSINITPADLQRIITDRNLTPAQVEAEISRLNITGELDFIMAEIGDARVAYREAANIADRAPAAQPEADDDVEVVDQAQLATALEVLGIGERWLDTPERQNAAIKLVFGENDRAEFERLVSIVGSENPTPHQVRVDQRRFLEKLEANDPLYKLTKDEKAAIEPGVEHLVANYGLDKKSIERLVMQADITVDDIQALIPTDEKLTDDELENVRSTISYMRVIAGTETSPEADELKVKREKQEAELERLTGLLTKPNLAPTLDVERFKELVKQDQLSIEELDQFIASIPDLADDKKKEVSMVVRRDLLKARDRSGKPGLTFTPQEYREDVEIKDDDGNVINNVTVRTGPVGVRTTVSERLATVPQNEKAQALVKIGQDLGLAIAADDTAKLGALERVLNTKPEDVQNASKDLNLLLGLASDYKFWAQKSDLYRRVNYLNRGIVPQPGILDRDSDAIGQINPSGTAPQPVNRPVTPDKVSLADKIKNKFVSATEKIRQELPNVRFQRPNLPAVKSIFAGQRDNIIASWEIAKQKWQEFNTVTPEDLRNFLQGGPQAPTPPPATPDDALGGSPTPPPMPTPPATNGGGAAAQPPVSEPAGGNDDMVPPWLRADGGAGARTIVSDSTGAAEPALNAAGALPSWLNDFDEETPAPDAEQSRLQGQLAQQIQANADAEQRIELTVEDASRLAKIDAALNATYATSGENAIYVPINDQLDKPRAAALREYERLAQKPWEPDPELVKKKAQPGLSQSQAQSQPSELNGGQEQVGLEGVGKVGFIETLEEEAAKPEVQKAIDQGVETQASQVIEQYGMNPDQARELKSLVDPRHLRNITPEQRLDFARRVFGAADINDARIQALATRIESEARDLYKTHFGEKVVEKKIEEQLTDPAFSKFENQKIGLASYLRSNINTDPNTFNLDSVIKRITELSGNRPLSGVLSQRERKAFKNTLIAFINENKQRRIGELDVIGQRLVLGTNGSAGDTRRLDPTDLSDAAVNMSGIGQDKFDQNLERLKDESDLKSALQAHDYARLRELMISKPEVVVTEVEGILLRLGDTRKVRFRPSDDDAQLDAEMKSNYLLLTGKPYSQELDLDTEIAELRARLQSLQPVGAQTPVEGLVNAARKDRMLNMSDVASTLEQNENGDNFKALVDIGESSIASVGHPESNQDRSYSNGLNTALVADGMGGYTGGEAAAKACLEAANISLNALTPNNKPSEIEQAFRTFFSEAASNVNSIVGKANAVAALASWSISPEGKRSVVVGWVGDARVYGFDRFGRLVKLTHDESFLRNSLLSEGETPEALRQIETIEHFLDHAQTEDDIKRYPKEQRALLEMANNTKHIASNSIRDDKPNIVTYDAENLALAGVFVTSDGIHDNLTDPEIQRIVTVSIEKGLNWSEIASKLAQEASQRSTQGLYRSKPDDCTVVGMTIPQTI